MSNRVFNVLFLCSGNSARSIMAEAIVTRMGRGRFRGFSAGARPRGFVHPFTIDLLKKLKYETDGFRSKSWDEFGKPDAPPMDFIFTVCDDAAGETCPVWPGQPMTSHWAVPNPANAKGTEVDIRLAFAEAYRMLHSRITVFANLPLETLDRMALKKRLSEISRADELATADAD